MLSAVCTQCQGMLLRFAQTWFCGMFGDCCNGSFCNRRFVSAVCYFLWQRMLALVKLQKLQPQQDRIRLCWCLAVDRIRCYAGCVWHVHAYLVLHLYTCSFVHRTCVYMCAVWTFTCMLRTHAQRAMALSSCLIQGNQVVKPKVHFHNNNLSRLTEVLAWQILCGNGWRINYLLCLFACLMVQTKATKWSNTGTLPPTATVATEPTATVACLHWLTHQMLKTWAGCTTKAS